MREKVEAMSTYATVWSNSDLLGLLTLIKHASFDFHSQKNFFHVILEVEKAFKHFHQLRNMPLDEYHDKCRHLAKAYESCGGSVGYANGLI